VSLADVSKRFSTKANTRRYPIVWTKAERMCLEFSGNEKWGSDPKLSWCWATATADEIIEHVRGQIARYKVPDYIDFVAELPKTFTGKIQK